MNANPHPAYLIALAVAGGLFAWSRSETGSSMVAKIGEAPSGYRNNNPGNIRFITGNPWTGQTGNYKGYAIYDTPAHGVRAIGKQLEKYYRSGYTTIAQMISRYAPANENDTNRYIGAVASELHRAPTEPFDVRMYKYELARAIMRQEIGGSWSTREPYTDANVRRWVNLT
jgi:hypothetical protein